MKKFPTIAIVAVVVLSICSATFAAEPAGAASAGVVNINTADADQLSNLPGVGAKAAQRIIEYRKQQGSFQKATDLMQVKGFGQKRFDAVSRYLTVEGKTTLTSKVASPRKPRKQPATTASE